MLLEWQKKIWRGENQNQPSKTNPKQKTQEEDKK